MENNIIEYKGYHSRIRYDVGDKVLHGKIEGIDDLISFESKNVDEIEKEFHEAVDEYLEFCKEIGKTPEKEYKGIFNVRVKPEIHKKLSKKASEEGITLNALVERAFNQFLMTN